MDETLVDELTKEIISFLVKKDLTFLEATEKVKNKNRKKHIKNR